MPNKLLYNLLKLKKTLLNKRQTKLFGFFYPTFDKNWKYLFKEIFKEETYYFTADSDSPNIIDCGANVGMSLVYFKQLYPNAKVTAIEASPTTFKKLAETLALNGFQKVQLKNVALSDRIGTIDFFEAEEQENLGNSIFARKGLKSKVTVNTELLSNFITSEVDFIKIDIEGAESLVLKDLDQSKKLSLIEKGVIEYHEIPENSLDFILKTLANNNFEYRINRSSKDTALIYFTKSNL